MARSMPAPHTRTESSTNIHRPGPTVLPDHLRRASSLTCGQAWPGSGKPESLVNGHGKARTPVTRYVLDQGLEFLQSPRNLGSFSFELLTS